MPNRSRCARNLPKIRTAPPQDYPSRREPSTQPRSAEGPGATCRPSDWPTPRERSASHRRNAVSARHQRGRCRPPRCSVGVVHPHLVLRRSNRWSALTSLIPCSSRRPVAAATSSVVSSSTSRFQSPNVPGRALPSAMSTTSTAPRCKLRTRWRLPDRPESMCITRRPSVSVTDWRAAFASSVSSSSSIVRVFTCHVCPVRQQAVAPTRRRAADRPAAPLTPPMRELPAVRCSRDPVHSGAQHLAAAPERGLRLHFVEPLARASRRCPITSRCSATLVSSKATDVQVVWYSLKCDRLAELRAAIDT